MKQIFAFPLFTAIVFSAVALAQSGITTTPSTALSCPDGVNCALPGSLSVRNTLLDPNYGISTPSVITGRPFLRQWQYKLAAHQGPVTGTKTVFAYIGDSWVANNGIWNGLEVSLQSQFGNAGLGYVSFNTFESIQSFNGIYFATRTTLGTWTERHKVAGALGPDLADATTTDTATPANRAILATAETMVLYYAKQSGGGTFRYKIDAGSWTTIDTSNATTAVATVSIATGSYAPHTLTVEIVSASTTGITLLGVDCQTSKDGVRIHKLGAGGATAQSFLDVDPVVWKASLTTLAPDVILITLGTNEDLQNVPPATLGSTLSTLIGLAQAAVPTADIVLVTPADNGQAGLTYTMDQYIAQERAIAVTGNFGFVDTYTAFGPYAAGNARGMYVNPTHPSVIGGRAIENLIESYLTQGLPCATCTQSASRGGLLNYFAGSGGNLTATGGNNVGIGAGSLNMLTTGAYNFAIGPNALFNTTTGSGSVAIGLNAAYNATGGASSTTAIGGSACRAITTSPNNTCVGNNAGYTNSSAVFQSTAIGQDAALTASYQVAIATATEQHVIPGRYKGLNMSSTPEGGCTAKTDLVVDGTSSKKVTSAGYTFVAADVDGILAVTTGAGWTIQDYRILSVAAGAATLDRSPAAISTTGGTYSLNRGRIQAVLGAGGVADTLRVCRKDAADAYAWTALY